MLSTLQPRFIEKEGEMAGTLKSFKDGPEDSVSNSSSTRKNNGGRHSYKNQSANEGTTKKGKTTKVPPISIKFTADQFKSTKWDTAEEKAKFCNQFTKFVDNGFQYEHFPKWFYRHLTNLFGFIAHYNQDGFYEHYFARSDELERGGTFLYECQHPWFGISGGNGADSWGDVELALQCWIGTRAFREEEAKAQQQPEKENTKKDRDIGMDNSAQGTLFMFCSQCQAMVEDTKTIKSWASPNGQLRVLCRVCAKIYSFNPNNGEVGISPEEARRQEIENFFSNVENACNDSKANRLVYKLPVERCSATEVEKKQQNMGVTRKSSGGGKGEDRDRKLYLVRAVEDSLFGCIEPESDEQSEKSENEGSGEKVEGTGEKEQTRVICRFFHSDPRVVEEVLAFTTKLHFEKVVNARGMTLKELGQINGENLSFMDMSVKTFIEVEQRTNLCKGKDFVLTVVIEKIPSNPS